MLNIQVLRTGFVARVTGIDLRHPLSENEFMAIREAFDQYAVVVIPNQPVTDEQQIAFSERFGVLEPSVRRHRKRNVENAHVSDLTNVDPKTGGLLADNSESMSYYLSNQLWHSDSSFKKISAQASLLSGREVPPEGAQTEFADTRAAWESLPPDRQAWLAKQTAMHSLAHSRGLMGYDTGKEFFEVEKKEMPPVPQPMIHENLRTGRKALYVGSHAFSIVGMADADGLTIIEGLVTHATQPKFVYSHQWQQNDLVMWDNRASLHRGRPWDTQLYRRVMRRTTIAGPESEAA